MISHVYLAIAVLLLAALAPATAGETSATRPNILFIFSDDHAQHAISVYGSKINQTPNIDRLAQSGVRFINSFVVNSICTNGSFRAAKLSTHFATPPY